MTETIEFTSAARRDEPLMFKIDGQEYGFRPPKAAVQMMPIYTGATDVDYMEARFDWLEKGLNSYEWALLDETAKRAAHGVEADEEGKAPPLPAGLPAGWRGSQASGLEARLRDDNDAFDVPDLEKVLDRLTREVAGRPTT